MRKRLKMTKGKVMKGENSMKSNHGDTVKWTSRNSQYLQAIHLMNPMLYKIAIVLKTNHSSIVEISMTYDTIDGHY